MPDSLTPPADAAHDAGVLLLWVCGLLTLSVVAQWWHSQKVRTRNEELLQKQVDDGKESATLFSEVRAAMIEGRASDASLKEAVYAMRDEIRILKDALGAMRNEVKTLRGTT